MFQRTKRLIERINDVTDIQTDFDNLTLKEKARVFLHYTSMGVGATAVLVALFGSFTYGLTYIASKLPEPYEQKERTPVISTVSFAQIDRDGLDDIIIEIEGKKVPLLADRENSGLVQYRPLTESDIYRIR